MCLCGEAHHVGKGHTWSFSLFGSGGLCLVRTMLKFSEHERSKLIRIPTGHGCGEGEGTGWGMDHTMPSWSISSLVTIREVGHLLSSLEEPLVGTPTLHCVPCSRQHSQKTGPSKHCMPCGLWEMDLCRGEAVERVCGWEVALGH